jgi:acyl carrier protein
VTIPDANTIRSAARQAAAEIAGGPVTDTEPLISSGRIDSLSVVRLIMRLEQMLHVSLPAANLQPDDFENIELMIETVERAAVSS